LDVPILSASLKTESYTDRLYCNVSAYTSMITTDETNAIGSAAIASAMASISVQVLVDGVVAWPGPETFNSVLNVLDAQLSSGESLEVMESRATCNSFEFVAPVTPGTHTVQVTASLAASATGVAAGLVAVQAGIFDRTLVVRPGRVSCETGTVSS
jgi:hypothetical protein